MTKDTLLFTEYWDITTTYTIFETIMPDGKYIMWTWDNNHKLIEKDIWKLWN